jgi:hypothetical protein
MGFDYEKLLENPLWKAKRKRIILRDGKKCTVCGSTTRLQVHHTYYYKQQVEPWRYPDESLLTVCKDCHQNHHEHSENEYRDKPKIKIKGKTKILKEGVHGKKRRKKRKGPNQSRPCKCNPYYAKPCLATSQAIRLGYSKNSWGKWVKTE